MAPLAGPGGAGDCALPGPPGALAVGMRKANDNEEAILVTVRVRPLSSQELAERDVAVWRCTDEKTLTFMDHVPERSPYPSNYAFDRVFGPVASSEQVYAEAARDLVQSSLSGLNATVFAYGQTSSGKTHTMRAVSRSAVQDIFEHIQRTPQREYLIRVSALEIYNEVVRDLLRPDSGPLRLLDDPERGTVVERLAEEVVRSSGHLYQILEDCEAQRQVGETMLNDNSSRSHQIIRLSVESCPSMEEGMVAGAGGSHVLMSVLNFVDLAGSERASQTLAEGARLKEGGHINRSLLTLGTVIRKLGESNKLRRGHIPYRDSKLTRILQHSLGGNARTAIICTMSPARAHVEQTRNTLSFATRAKEVTNSAHVNLVVSDKVLIKRLQREVARLEAELAVAASPRELQARDIRIQQIEMQLHELVRQRDAAQAHARELTKAMIKGDRGDETSQKATKSWSPDTVKKLLRRSGKKKKTRLGAPDDVSIESAPLFGTSASRFLEYKEMRERRRERQREREREREAEAAVLDGEKRKLETMHERLGQGADVAMQALHKEIECLRLAQAQAVVGGAKSADIAGMIDKLQAELEGLQAAQAASVPEEDAGTEPAPEGEAPAGVRKAAVNASMERMIQLLRDELARLQSATKADEKADQEISALEEKLESAQLSLDKFYDSATPGDDPLLSSGRRVLAPRSPGGANAAGPPASPRLHRRSPSAGGALPGGHQENDENVPGGQDSGHYSAPEDGEKTPRRGGASSVDIRRMQSLFKTAAEENVRSIKNYVTELKERIAKLHYQKQLLVCQVLELEGAARRSGEESEGPAGLRPEVWAARCEEQTAAIVQLWDMCNVSLFHRTQFYLLFSSAAAADHVYLEVEQRRLEWLREQCLLTLEDGHDEPRAIRGSLKRLRHERDVLARRMRDRLSDMERGLLFEQWGVPLTSKARKQQLAALVWNNPFDAKLVRDSADLVARLMDFGDASAMVPKEMFGLRFAQPGRKRNWLMRIASTG